MKLSFKFDVKDEEKFLIVYLHDNSNKIKNIACNFEDYSDLREALNFCTNRLLEITDE